MAGAYTSLRRYEDCSFALDQCLEIQLNVLPPKHIDTAVTHKMVGLVYYITGRYDEALSSFRKCLDMQMSLLSPDDRELVDTRSQIDDVSRNLNNSSNAHFT